VLLYTVVLFAATLLPFIYRHERLDLPGRGRGAGRHGFIAYGLATVARLQRRLARKTFRFSIWHLSLLFAALLLDHYLTHGCTCSSPDPAALPAALLLPPATVTARRQQAGLQGHRHHRRRVRADWTCRRRRPRARWPTSRAR
jgi:hypothetical protein